MATIEPVRVKEECESVFDIKQTPVSVSPFFYPVPDVRLTDRIFTSIPTCLRKLDLSGNYLTNLPKELEICNNLEEIDLSRNKISDLDNYLENIASFPSLRRVDISHNSLKEFPDFLAKSSILTCIDISYNEVHILPEKLACNMTLKSLNISWNVLECSLGQFFMWLGQFSICSKLDFCGNPLGDLVKNRNLALGSNNRRLKSIKMGNLSMTRIPEDVTTLLDMKHLSFSNKSNLHTNSIMKVPPSISKLCDLVTLDLAGLGLVELPQTLGLLINLKILDISKNHIFSLPSSFINLVSLRLLNASSNDLLLLPQKLSQMLSLEHMLMSGNNLSSLPSFLPPNLLTLDLYHNKMSSISPAVLEMTSLKRCDIAANMMSISQLELQLGDVIFLKYNRMEEALRSWSGPKDEHWRLDTEMFLCRNGFPEDDVEDNDSVTEEAGRWQSEEYLVFGQDLESESDLAIDPCNNIIQIQEEYCGNYLDWEDYMLPTQSNITYNLERMDLVQFWGKEQFCPADHHNSCINQLVAQSKKMESCQKNQGVRKMKNKTEEKVPIVGQFEDVTHGEK